MYTVAASKEGIKREAGWQREVLKVSKKYHLHGILSDDERKVTHNRMAIDMGAHLHRSLQALLRHQSPGLDGSGSNGWTARFVALGVCARVRRRKKERKRDEPQ